METCKYYPDILQCNTVPCIDCEVFGAIKHEGKKVCEKHGIDLANFKEAMNEEHVCN